MYLIGTQKWMTEVDEHILKVGRGIKNDLKQLQTEANIKDSFPSAVELAPLAKRCHVAPNVRVGLKELSARMTLLE